jgi:hypothetical protein
MEGIVLSELQDLKERSEDNPIEQDDTFIDFATEEFVAKNIRVRPISGATHGDDTKDGRQSNVSKGGDGDEGDKETKANLEANIELNEQRVKVKDDARKFKDEQRKKQLQEEKKQKR